jgi:hypothetical protein
MSFTNTDELFGVMKDELKRMPAARPEDVWLLLYENEFGPEPFDGTEEELQNGLEADMASVEYEEDAELSGGTEESFRAKLDWVTEHFQEFKFRFSKQEWTDLLERRTEAAAEETEDDGAEKEAELPETNRILLRVVIGLILCLLAVGLAVAGRILYTAIVLK